MVSPKQQTKEDVIETIKKLLNVNTERGATSGEQANAAAVVQGLLFKHGLSMLEVDEHKVKEEFQADKEEYVSEYKKIPSWSKHLYDEISAGLECRLVFSHAWVEGQGRRAKLVFIGQPADAAIAKYLSNKLEYELYWLATREGKSLDFKSGMLMKYRNNFLTAAAFEIGRRLRDNRKELVKDNVGGNQLVVLKGKLAESKMNDLFPSLQGISVPISRGVGSGDGREAGKRADIDVNKIQGSNGEAPKRLT